MSSVSWQRAPDRERGNAQSCVLVLPIPLLSCSLGTGCLRPSAFPPAQNKAFPGAGLEESGEKKAEMQSVSDCVQAEELTGVHTIAHLHRLVPVGGDTTQIHTKTFITFKKEWSKDVRPQL